MTEHPTFEVPPGEDILHGLTETSPELDGLRIDMPPVVVLFIDNTDSRCGACGKTALPTDVAHTTPCGYDNHDGCRATFTHVSSNYGGDDSKRASMAVRPDLPWMDYGEAHKHDGARKPRRAATAAAEAARKDAARTHPTSAVQDAPEEYGARTYRESLEITAQEHRTDGLARAAALGFAVTRIEVRYDDQPMSLAAAVTAAVEAFWAGAR